MDIQSHTDDIIKMYTSGCMTTVEISDLIGCSSSGVERLLRRNGVAITNSSKRVKLAEADAEKICERYLSGETSVEISSCYGVCDATIIKILRANGVSIKQAKRRSVITNHDYFEKIDSVGKAYFLGWMISDGCIIDNKTRPGRSNVISLEIQSGDADILNLFAEELGAVREIVKDCNRGHSYIRFSSSQMSSDLSKYGVIPRKSWITYLPSIPDIYMPHLIRGYFDGNGTIVRDKRKANYARVGFYGSEQICNDIVALLHKELSIRKNKVSKSTCYHVWCGGIEPVCAIGNYMYSGCGRYYLQRKYDKFSAFL